MSNFGAEKTTTDLLIHNMLQDKVTQNPQAV